MLALDKARLVESVSLILRPYTPSLPYSATPELLQLLSNLGLASEDISEFRSQEFRSQRIWQLWRRFSQGDAGPGFSDKDLARLFCNSCNS
jgi:hypothetical protein